MSIDVRLIAICDPSVLGAGAIASLQAVEAGGATALQVRMKNNGAGELLRWTERLIRSVTIPVYVNDRADIAWAAGAAGVHLGADDLPADRVRGASPGTFRIGVSVGTDAEAARAMNGGADYWSLGAVFATGTKADAEPPIGVDGFRSLARLVPAHVPVIAIGGITARRARAVCEAGARGVAVVSAIFDAPNPERATRELRAAVEEGLAGAR